MLALVKTYLPWIISSITIWITIMQGNKHPKAWLIGLFNQCLWLTWILVDQAWGLLPLNFMLWILYYRNHVKWQREHAQSTKPA